MFFLSYQLL